MGSFAWVFLIIFLISLFLFLLFLWAIGGFVEGVFGASGKFLLFLWDLLSLINVYPGPIWMFLVSIWPIILVVFLSLSLLAIAYYREQRLKEEPEGTYNLSNLVEECCKLEPVKRAYKEVTKPKKKKVEKPKEEKVEVNKAELIAEEIKKFKPEWDSKKELVGGENGASRDLEHFLIGKGFNVQREVSSKSGDRVDLLWEEGKVIIEAKIDLGYTDPYTVNNVIGKILPYKDRYKGYQVVAVFYGDARQDELLDLYKYLEGIVVVVLGRIRRKGEK